MVRAKRFELRAGNEVWATLSVDPDGEKTLEHPLTEDEVSRCTGVGVYDSVGRMLTINKGDHCIYLDAPDGRRQLKLQVGSDDEISDVVDPKAQVQLVIKLYGGGSGGNDPIQAGEDFFNLCWIAHAD
jgi:hypothetical protein